MRTVKIITGLGLLLLAGLSILLVVRTHTKIDLYTYDDKLYIPHEMSGKIIVCSISPEDGKLTIVQKLDLNGASPHTIANSPNTDTLYVAVDNLKTTTGFSKYGIAIVEREKDGSLKLSATHPVENAGTQLAVDKTGRYLAAVDYYKSMVSVYELKGSIYTGKVIQQITSGITTHDVEFAPHNNAIYVPHTDMNGIYQYRFDSATGKLSSMQPAFVAGPRTDRKFHKPRHMVMHPSLMMAFTSNEEGGGISSWSIDAESGKLGLNETLSTLPEGLEKPASASDIDITPSGKFIYVANRVFSKLKIGVEGTVAGFSIDPKTGKLTKNGHFPACLIVNSIAIDSRGQYLYAACIDSTVLAYRIDASTGKLHPITEYEF